MMFDHANNLARKACLALASAYPVFVSHTISNQIQQANPEQASDWSAKYSKSVTFRFRLFLCMYEIKGT